MFLSRVAKKVFVVRDGVFISGSLSFETHIVWMGVQKSLAAALGNPIKLLFPDIEVSLAKNRK